MKTSQFKITSYYKIEDKKIFFGHYWLQGKPSLYKENICCLDYSVAKEGKPVDYRFDGVNSLDNRKFVFV